MSDFKPFVVGPPPDLNSPTIKALMKERKDVPYVVVKYSNGNTSVWERGDKGRVRCVHGGLKKEDEENAIVSRAFQCDCEVYYCTKNEAFMLCL